MTENDTLIVDMTTKIFRDLADPQTINNAADAAWRAPLWSALEEAGLTRAWLAEEFGGAGISISDGFEVLRVLRQDADTEDIRVLACTAFRDPDLDARVARERFDGFVEKPLKMSSLLVLVRKLLGMEAIDEDGAGAARPS